MSIFLCSFAIHVLSFFDETPVQIFCEFDVKNLNCLFSYCILIVYIFWVMNLLSIMWSVNVSFNLWLFFLFFEQLFSKSRSFNFDEVLTFFLTFFFNSCLRSTCTHCYFYFLFMYLWLSWVFVATQWLSLAVESKSYSLVRGARASHWSCLFLCSTGSRCMGFRSCGMWIRDWTPVSYIGRQTLIHCATREVETRNHFLRVILMLYLRKICLIQNHNDFSANFKKIHTVYSKAYWKLFLNEYSY